MFYLLGLFSQHVPTQKDIMIYKIDTDKQPLFVNESLKHKASLNPGKEWSESESDAQNIVEEDPDNLGSEQVTQQQSEAKDELHHTSEEAVKDETLQKVVYFPSSLNLM